MKKLINDIKIFDPQNPAVQIHFQWVFDDESRMYQFYKDDQLINSISDSQEAESFWNGLVKKD